MWLFVDGPVWTALSQKVTNLRLPITGLTTCTHPDVRVCCPCLLYPLSTIVVRLVFWYFPEYSYFLVHILIVFLSKTWPDPPGPLVFFLNLSSFLNLSDIVSRTFSSVNYLSVFLSVSSLSRLSFSVFSYRWYVPVNSVFSQSSKVNSIVYVEFNVLSLMESLSAHEELNWTPTGLLARLSMSVAPFLRALTEGSYYPSTSQPVSEILFFPHFSYSLQTGRAVWDGRRT